MSKHEDKHPDKHGAHHTDKHLDKSEKYEVKHEVKPLDKDHTSRDVPEKYEVKEPVSPQVEPLVKPEVKHPVKEVEKEPTKVVLAKRKLSETAEAKEAAKQVVEAKCKELAEVLKTQGVDWGTLLKTYLPVILGLLQHLLSGPEMQAKTKMMCPADTYSCHEAVVESATDTLVKAVECLNCCECE